MHSVETTVNVTNLIKEIPFREDFPCYSTWKRCKHSGHFSRFRIIIGNFCNVNQKCNVLSRAINFGRQCHFKIWLDCHKFLKNFPA
jgi:hypothetical protein